MQAYITSQTPGAQRYGSMLLLIGAILCASWPVYAHDYFVAPEGHDNNDGSFDHPFKTVDKAGKEVRAGDTIFLRGGLHLCTQTIRIEQNGETQYPITLQAYEDEVPVLDFQNSGSTDRGINLRGSFWHIKGLIVQCAGDNGIIVYGAHNILERIVTRANGDSGIQLHTGAAFNQIRNCDSCLNYDPLNNGENADGFAAKFGLGPGNTFIGCRAWGNSDDGYDFWEAGDGVTLINCWAFRNGRISGRIPFSVETAMALSWVTAAAPTSW